MTWTKLGDEFGDECWTLTDAAFRLHAEGLLWSNRMLTDGQLSKDDMKRWAHQPEAAGELVDRGYWEDHCGHYQIIHHIGYQPLAESVRRVSLANRANAEKRWAKKTRQQPPNKDSSNDPSCDLQCDSHNDSHCDMDGTGRDGPGQQNRGTSLRNGQPKKSDHTSDEEYAASLREWYEEEP